jgi:SAM-dependent methyltransferase
MKEPAGVELIQRHRTIYEIPAETQITEGMVRRHWDLERRLTHELLESTPETRWEVFERSYSTLYRELPWLNHGSEAPKANAYADWPGYVGPPPKDVYEVGSGSGALALFLADRGYRCRATEITRERGDWDRADHPNLSWGTTDGVHLDRFEPPGSYDAVISNQVIEHLHPDDLECHLRSARALLRPGGRYVLSTPHVHRGPSDVSAVFRRSQALGMHLREYTWGELSRLLRRAGYARVRASLRGRPSRIYLGYMRVAERLVALFPSQVARRVLVRRVLRPPLFARDVTLIAETDRAPS